MQSVLIVLSVLSFQVVSGAEWCYQSQVSCPANCTGPAEWAQVSGNCSHSAQSPINIVTRKVIFDKQLLPFKLTGSQSVFNATLVNNGHTVQLDLPDSIKLSGGNLSVAYKALQLHLHWGNNGGPGSEHTIDGEQFPMEMHIVYIKDNFNNITQAKGDRFGVAVLGFFFQESTSANKAFNPLTNALANITQPSNITLEDVNLETFLPPSENLTRYFRYSGSLTTPDCAEAVVWTVFENAIPLSRDQLASFSQLRFPDNKSMVNTFRPVQPLNGRQVFFSAGQVAVLSSLALISSVLCSAISLLTV